MSYAGGNKGGTSAILATEELLKERADANRDIAAESVYAAIPEYIDAVMGEGGLWDPILASRAVLQAAGDQAEAVHLLRAHRSTLPRLARSEPVNPDEMQLLRRIVPAQRNPDGPQMLGLTFDYSPRLISDDGDPLKLDADDLTAGDSDTNVDAYADKPVERFSTWLRERDLLVSRHDESDPEPYDLTLHPISLPAERSALLSAMSVAETGALVNAWYRGVTGPDGHTDEHITLGDVRYGRLDLNVAHPHTGNPVTVGEIRASDCETMEHLGGRGSDTSRFDTGYGFAFGHNERKAIAMSAMDLAVTTSADSTHLEQVLMHTTDGLAANGFLEHLKMPHYVTFRSQVERAQAAQAVQNQESK